MLSTSVNLFSEYLRRVIDCGQPIIVDAHTQQHNFAVEVLDRLRLLNFVVNRLKDIESPFFSTPQEEAIYLEARVLTDAFYYLAFRTREVLRTLPTLEAFECVSIRDVRNHLLEHPNREDSKVVNMSFGWCKPDGPVIKPVRYSGQRNISVDTGLFVAAESFQIRLTELLRESLNAVDTEQPAEAGRRLQQPCQ